MSAQVTHVLGFGMQSSGSTVISAQWQRRPDCDGVLDVNNRKLPLLWFTRALAPRTTIFHQKLTLNSKKGFDPQVVARLVKAGFQTPDVKWYLILRNPYDIVVSLKNKIWGARLERKLKKYNRIYRFVKTHDIPRIKYEDFVQNPSTAMWQLFKAVGVPPVPIDPSERLVKKVYFKPQSDQPTFAANMNAVVVLPRRFELGAGDKLMVQQCCRDVLKGEGYKY